MINIWRLTKIQLLPSFGLNKALHARDAKERRKLLLASIGIVTGMLAIAVASYGYSYAMAIGFEQIGRLELLLAVMMAVTSVVGFFTTIYKASGVLFDFKDYDLVMSLPVKTSHVVASRVLQLYGLNLFFTLIVMLPAGAVYALKMNPNALYYVLFLITLLCIPLVPIIAATIIGAMISWISSRFRGSRVISLVLTFAVIIAFMAGSFQLNGNEQLLADAGAQMVDMIYKLYPLTAMYVDAVCSYRIGSFLLFVAISLIAFMLFAVVLGSRFKAIYTGMTTSHTRSKYQMKSLQASTPFYALYKKELRRYFSSYLYVMNTSIGMILLLVMSIAILFVGSDELGQLIEIPELSIYLDRLAPLFVSLFIVISCTSVCSISLEGRNIWILKSSPVSKLTILLSKVAVNLTITVPILVISCALLVLSLHTGWVESLMLFLIPILYACFTAMAGVLINLKLPKMEWTSEVTVIKQSAAVLVSMLIGFISLAIPCLLSLLLADLNGNLILLGTGIVLIMACGVMYQYMRTKGEQLFQAL